MNSEVLKNISYGMYAVGVKDSDKVSASIINSVTQISSGSAVNLAVCVNKSSYTAYCIKKSAVFTVSVLSQETPATIIGVLGLVSGKKTDKLRNVRHKVLNEGVPVLKENTCCWFLCKLIKTVEIGDQYIFIGTVEAGSDVSIGVPMTYDYYTNVLNGTAPMDTPSYIAPQQTFDKSSGESFACKVCGYVYNDPNFSFEELGDKWLCPVCKMPKSAFFRKK